MLCKNCHNNIKHLYVRALASVGYEVKLVNNNSKEELVFVDNFDEVEVIRVDSYECPMCGIIVATSEEDAISMLKNTNASKSRGKKSEKQKDFQNSQHNLFMWQKD